MYDKIHYKKKKIKKKKDSEHIHPKVKFLSSCEPVRPNKLTKQVLWGCLDEMDILHIWEQCGFGGFGAECQRLDVRVPPKFMFETFSSDVMVLGGEAFGR